MKLIFLFLILTAAGISFLSCNEEFDPFGEYKERYALFSVIRSDSVFQTVMIGRSYGNGSLEPLLYEGDHSVTGAEVRVWRGDSVYFFRDSSINSSQIKFYYNDKFSADYDEEFEIEALLPNGRRLKAETTTPKEFIFKSSSEVLIPPVSRDFVQVDWNRNNEGIYFQPKLCLRYRIEGDPVIKLKEIPLRYVLNGDSFDPVFPKPSANLSVIYEMDAVNRALNEISGNDPDKSKFSIYENLVFIAAAFDVNLSRYLSTTSRSFNDLTVNVNESDYTNINGGFGIFGSYVTKEYTSLRFQPGYIFSFGYNFINE